MYVNLKCHIFYIYFYCSMIIYCMTKLNFSKSWMFSRIDANSINVHFVHMNIIFYLIKLIHYVRVLIHPWSNILPKAPFNSILVPLFRKIRNSLYLCRISLKCTYFIKVNGMVEEFRIDFIFCYTNRYNIYNITVHYDNLQNQVEMGN